MDDGARVDNMIKKFYKGDYNRNHCEVWTVDDIDFEDYFGDVGTDYADKFVDLLNQMNDENNQLKSENKRLTDKLNKIALEFLNYDMVTMGKATEISEMCYSDFLKFRKENGNPMELQL